MSSLLLWIFLLQLVIHLINSVGASTVNELAWLLYGKLPTNTAHAAQEQGRLKGEVVRLKREMNAVSAQDNFAKWAKLRRQHDKAVADFEKSDGALRAFKTTFDTAINTLRWVGTTGLRFFIQFWFAKQPLFWIPQGWLPGYVEWILSFPRAPKGSISVQIWAIACGSVIAMAAEAIKAIYALATGNAADQKAGPKTASAQAFPAGSQTGDSKKEL